MCIKLLIAAQRIRNHTMSIREDMIQSCSGVLHSYKRNKEDCYKGYEVISNIRLHEKKKDGEKYVHVEGVPQICIYKYIYICVTYLKNEYLVSAVSSGHRAPKNLIISPVIRKSFVLTAPG